MMDFLARTQLPLLPEIPLWLANPASAWWYLHPDDLAAGPYADPYWAFCWPGGAALARFLLAHPSWVKDRLVVDIGTGCGVVAIAAKKAGARKVIANDIDPWALKATRANAELNGVELTLSEANLLEQSLPPGTLVLLGDMLYEAQQSQSIIAWCKDLQSNDCKALLADPRRGFGLADELALAWVETASEIDPGDARYRTQVGIWEFTGSFFPV